MTAASQQPSNSPGERNQQLTRAEEAVVAAIAVFLASRWAVNASRLPVALVGRLTALGLSQRAVREAGRMVMAPPLTGRTRWGSPAATGDIVSAVRTVAADEPMMRARYLLNAAKRLTAAIVDDDFARALKNERRYLNQHRLAGIGRRAGAAEVDAVAARSNGYLVWVGGTCDECAPLDGQVFRVGNMPLPPIHPNCLIGSTRVSTVFETSLVVAADVAHHLPANDSAIIPSNAGYGGSLAATAVAEAKRDFGRRNIRAVTVREYVGDILTIVTASGKELTGTPNHPIATPSGWVALAELHMGMHVLSSTGAEWEPSTVDPDVDDVPPTIEQVSQTFPVVLDPMPTAPEDFHGDGAGSDVHVVLADGFLSSDDVALCAQHLAERQLSRGDVAAQPALSGARSSLTLGQRGLPAASRFVGRSSHLGALLRRCLTHVERHRLASRAHVDSALNEQPGDGRAADSEGFCERLHALPGEVSADQVVDVRRYPFSGHVYNLETVDGWFMGNGIVTHNCSCHVRPL